MMTTQKAVIALAILLPFHLFIYTVKETRTQVIGEMTAIEVL